MSQQLPLPLRLDPELSFERYLRGPNHESVEHLMASARGEGFPLIFLHAAPGLGKSHLLQASALESARCGHSVIVLDLTNQAGMEPSSLEGLGQLDLVCLDGLETVCGDPGWELALFRLFQTLEESRRHLIMASRLPPDRLNIQLADLCSRFQSALILRLRALSEDETLLAFSQRAENLGLEIRPEVGRYLMRHVQRDLNSLVRLLDQLESASLAAHRRLTIPFVRAWLENRPATGREDSKSQDPIKTQNPL